MKKLISSILIVSIFCFFTPTNVQASGIAFDNAASSSLFLGTTSGTLTGFTVTGSNTMLIVTVTPVTGTGPTGCTWNGSAMTQIDVRANSDGSNMAQYVFAGASGTHDIVCTWGSGVSIFVAASYTGVNQSNTPDNHTYQNVTASPDTTTLNPVTGTGCWTFLSIYSNNLAPTAGSGSFIREVGSNVTIAFADSNGTVSSGSVSMTITGAATSFATMMTSFCPVAGGASAFNFWQFFGF